MEHVRPENSGQMKTNRTKGSLSDQPLPRRIVLLMFAVAGILLFSSATVAGTSMAVIGELGIILVVLAVLFTFICGGKEIRWTYVQLSTGSSFIMGAVILAIYGIETRRQRWEDSFAYLSLGLLFTILVLNMMTTRPYIKKLRKVEPVWYGVLSLGFIYIFSFVHQYTPIVLEGTNRISTRRGSMEFIQLPWILSGMIIYSCLFTTITALYIVYAWSARQKNAMKPRNGIGNGIGWR